MARILGIDLGSHSVKVMLVESTLRTSSVRVYRQARRGAGTPAESLKAALSEALGGRPPGADQVVLSLPGPALATHLLSMPFIDAKRIESALPFEVESALPFDLSEVLFDYQVAAQNDKRSELIIGMVKKVELAELLAILQAHKVDPRVVTHPGMAYQNFIASPSFSFGLEPGESAAIIDLGHERISLAIGQPGQSLEFARTFTGGGRDLTRALAQEFGISQEEAERWKEQYGAVADEASAGPDAERAGATFVRALQPVLRELRASFKAHSARFHGKIGALRLCGGTANLRGLAQQLAADLKVPTEVLELPMETREQVGPTEQRAAAQVYALALRGQASGAKAPKFNLRRGELAFKGDFDYVREKLGQIATFGIILFVLLIASGILQNAVLQRNERKVDQVLCDTTQRVLGKCERDFNRALSMLKGKESPTAAIPKLSAVTLLSELTNRLPTDIPLTVDQLVVDLDRITVRCETDSSKQVDKITTALKSFKCFKEIKEGKVEKSKDGQKVTFRLDIQVECPEPRGTPQG